MVSGVMCILELVITTTPLQSYIQTVGILPVTVRSERNATAVFNMLSGYSEPLSWNGQYHHCTVGFQNRPHQTPTSPSEYEAWGQRENCKGSVAKWIYHLCIWSNRNKSIVDEVLYEGNVCSDYKQFVPRLNHPWKVCCLKVLEIRVTSRILKWTRWVRSSLEISWR